MVLGIDVKRHPPRGPWGKPAGRYTGSRPNGDAFTGLTDIHYLFSRVSRSLTADRAVGVS
jgi:hypothetical protein